MEDLPELIDFMLQRLNKKHGTSATEISKDAVTALSQYNWPGNVRELEEYSPFFFGCLQGKENIVKRFTDTITSIPVATGNQPENIKEQPQLENLGGQHEDLNFPTALPRQTWVKLLITSVKV